MREAKIFLQGRLAGILREEVPGGKYTFIYLDDYDGPGISLTMPRNGQAYEYDRFPPFFEGLLPEGEMLGGLLRQLKIDAKDLFSQLMAVGRDLVGAVTVEEIK